MRMPRVLIACEFSGTVRRAFRAAGCDAWSCDLLPAEDGSCFHWQGDVRDMLANTDVWKWDLMIAHPPCTDLAVSGARYFAAKRADGRQQRAIDFVRMLLDAPIEHIALENPIGILSSVVRKPDQIIQPHQFGHDASKATCLWLKNLPRLTGTVQIAPGPNGRYGNQTASGQNKLGPSADRWKLRSLTYEGIAAAMAAQWAPLLFPSNS